MSNPRTAQRHMIMRRSVLSLLLAASAAFGITMSPARAADMAPATAPAQDSLGPSRALIQQERWRDAIATLKQLDDVGSADWNNLMGYSHRKAKTPDFAAAERYYTEALRIDPRHRGALEYSGELYLMMDDLTRAEAQLARLDKACTFGCPELKDLRQAVSAYKAEANKVAARP